MSLQLDHNVDLNRPSVLNWLAATPGSTLTEKPDDEDLISAGLLMHPGSENAIAQTSTVDFATATIRHYRVLEEDLQTGNQIVIGDFEVQVPVFHKIEVGLATFLYIADSGLSPVEKQAIVDAYVRFPPGDDPLSYLVDEARRVGISTDKFYVGVGHTLRLVDSTPWLDQVNALENLYSGGAKVDGDAEWFSKKRISLKLISEDQGQPLRTPSKDALKEQDAEGANPDTILDEIAEEIAGDLNCDDYYKKKKKEVMTVLAWPEFKVVWYPKFVKLGCTRVKIWLPKLKTRIAEVVLYAVVAVSRRQADNTLLRIVGDCAIASAIVGSVVGVVLGNFLAAEAAFVALFKRCIVIKVGQHVSCMVPTIALITEKGKWS